MKKRIVLFSVIFPVMVLAARAPLFPGDQKLAQQAWYPEKIDLFRAWKIVDQSPDVLVAVLDLDFDLDHPDLVGVIDKSVAIDYSGTNFKVHKYPEARHGTLVANILAANGFNRFGVSGITRRARIMPINWGANESISVGIVDAVRAGARVVNCSCAIVSPTKFQLKKIEEAIQFAQKENVVVVFSAGNYGHDGDKDPVYPAAFTTKYTNVISVGASKSDDTRGYSVYGSRTVDLFAPGHDIIAPHNLNDYDLSDGTSEAAPIVSGVIALMLQLDPTLTPVEIKYLLINSVDKVPALKGLSRSNGRLNAYRALKAVQLRTNN